jgi:hypothetical protein
MGREDNILTVERIYSSTWVSFDLQDWRLMNYKKCLGAASAALMIVIVVFHVGARRLGAKQIQGDL